MELNDFLMHVAMRKPLDTPEIMELLNRMSDEARRITFELNGSYHTMEEIRALMSRLFGRPVDDTFRVFPPFYTDFGKNIHIGKDVFINACCHFQDQGGVTLGDGCLIGHNVVFATLNHDMNPEKRAAMTPAPIVLGKRVWVGSNSTILQGVTIVTTPSCSRSRRNERRAGQYRSGRCAGQIHTEHRIIRFLDRVM